MHKLDYYVYKLCFIRELLFYSRKEAIKEHAAYFSRTSSVGASHPQFTIRDSSVSIDGQNSSTSESIKGGATIG